MSCISDNLEGAEDVRWRVFDGLRWIRIKKQPSVVTTAKTVRAMPKCKCGSKLSREGSGGGVDGDDFAGDDTASHENGDDGEKCDALGVATASGSVDGVYCSPHPSTFAGRILKRHSSATRHGSAKVSVHTASELHSTCSVPSLWSACQITAPLPSPGVGCFCWPLIACSLRRVISTLHFSPSAQAALTKALPSMVTISGENLLAIALGASRRRASSTMLGEIGEEAVPGVLRPTLFTATVRNAKAACSPYPRRSAEIAGGPARKRRRERAPAALDAGAGRSHAAAAGSAKLARHSSVPDQNRQVGIC
eukprot:431735-Pleurochrysis_carterae.AAC.1